MRMIGLVFLASAMLAQAPTFQPVASTLQLMEAMIIPSSNALFEVGASEPKDEMQWAAVRNNALILAESGNPLMMGARANDPGEWMKASRLLVAAGTAAYKAAQAKDVDKLAGDISEQILNSCQTCHERYMDKGKTQ